MPRTGIVKDERYLEHRAEFSHPESPQRLEVLYQMLAGPDLPDFLEIRPRLASREELELIHLPGYIQRIAATADRPCTRLDPDTYACAKSYEAALLAAGGGMEAVDRVWRGEVRNVFALVRPPGHHAESNRAMGFCLFNNVAISASYALKAHGLARVLIIDWDLHHGNGTQHSFYERPDVLYFSVHQYPYYPGTGAVQEAGSGAGEGYTVNVPLPPGPGDAEYLAVFQEVLEPIARQFRPELVFVSAGFDIYFRDPLGGMQVTPAGFAVLARKILDIAEEACGGKVVFLLEGGYHLQGLRDSVQEVLRVIADQGVPPEVRGKAGRAQIDPVLKRVKEVHRTFWKNL